MIIFVACQESNKPANKSLNRYFILQNIHMMCPRVKNNPNYHDDCIIMTIFDLC